MHSRPIACALSVLLPTLLASCASTPPPQLVRPDAPAEMMRPAPPPSYFVTTLRAILLRLP